MRVWVSGVCLLLLLGAVTGSLAAEPVTIEFTFPANPHEAEVWEKLAEIFNSRQDEIKVEVNWASGVGWDGFFEKTKVRMAAGTPPELIRLSDIAFPEWVAEGYLQPLDSFLQRSDVDKNDYLPVAFELGTLDGQFYGFPQGIATRCLAYNRALFQEAGLAYPTDDWRWDRELLEAAKALTDLEAEVPKYGVGFWFGGAGVLRMDVPEIIWSFGGEVFDAEGNFRLYEQEGMAAIEFLVSLIAEHKVATTGPHPMFVNGDLGMWNTGLWDVGLLRSFPNLDWDFAPTPGGPAGHYSFIMGNGIYVIPKSVDQEKASAAWEFARFLAGEEAQRIFNVEYAIGGVPIIRELLDEFQEQPAPPDSWEAAVTSVMRGRRNHLPPNSTDVFNALNEGWSEMLQGSLAPQVWMARVKPKVMAILGK